MRKNTLEGWWVSLFDHRKHTYTQNLDTDPEMTLWGRVKQPVLISLTNKENKNTKLNDQREISTAKHSDTDVKVIMPRPLHTHSAMKRTDSDKNRQVRSSDPRLTSQSMRAEHPLNS